MAIFTSIAYQLLLRHVHVESRPHGLHRGRPRGEAGELGARPHDVHQGHELVGVLAGRHQPLQDEDLEVLEHVALLAAHDLDKLGGHLEGGALEAQVLGGAAQDEAVVDVDEVALAVQQDVAVVAVLHLRKQYESEWVYSFCEDIQMLLDCKAWISTLYSHR